ncbi:MAG: hypothetical protein LBE38_09875 [Deltaproteobacteria bacterium]|nr:hypothetical protein [Deltaproteobacteria bacterium]
MELKESMWRAFFITANKNLPKNVVKPKTMGFAILYRHMTQKSSNKSYTWEKGKKQEKNILILGNKVSKLY